MDDLISRQAAIELILSGKVDDDSPEWVGVECPEECNSFLEWAAEEVGKMPSAERKKGKWIEDAATYYKAVNKKGGGVNEDTPYFTESNIGCSECLAMFNVIDNETERFDCGAEMRGDKDE